MLVKFILILFGAIICAAIANVAGWSDYSILASVLAFIVGVEICWRCEVGLGIIGLFAALFVTLLLVYLLVRSPSMPPDLKEAFQVGIFLSFGMTAMLFGAMIWQAPDHPTAP